VFRHTPVQRPFGLSPHAVRGLGVLALALACLLPSLARADISDERIQEVVLRVNRAADALGEARGAERLATVFRVPARVVADLYDQKLAFGEVAVVLALAETGRTSSDTILGLWASGRLNWGQIAERLKVDLHVLLRRLEGVRRDLTPPTR
jgi:hypothetical protein